MAKAGDIINVGGVDYTLNDEVANRLNKVGGDTSYLNQEHLKSMERSTPSTEAEIIASTVENKNPETENIWKKDVAKAVDKNRAQMQTEQMKATDTTAPAEPAPATEETIPDFSNVSNEDRATVEEMQNDPIVNEVLETSGVTTAETKDEVETAKSNMENQLEQEFGTKDIIKAGNTALQTNGWDTFAKIATGISLVGFMLTGGLIPPVNFMKLTGTQEKEAALRRIAETQLGKKAEAEGEAEGEVAATDVYSDEKSQFIADYKKSNPNATDEDAEKAYNERASLSGKRRYAATGADVKSEKDFERDLKRLDAQTKSNILARAADSTARINEIKAQGITEQERMALGNELQKDLTRELQDLSNKSTIEKYAYFKNSPFAKDFADFNDFNRQVLGNEKTTGEYVESYINTAVNAIGKNKK